MANNPLKAAIFNSGKKQLQLSINTGIHHTRLNLIINGWIKANDEEKRLLAEELGQPESVLFPDYHK